MPRTKTVSLYLALALLVINQQAFAEPGTERITLMLSGIGCETLRDQLPGILGGSEGVLAVDGRSIPGHLLVDVERGRVTGEQLVHRVAEMATACQAGVMESCITAGNLPAR